MIRPFIIFAQERTGSSTLILLLNSHSQIKCLFEPFSPANVTTFAAHCEMLRRNFGIESALQWLWRGCNGFKHVWKRTGWPFEDMPDDNRRLLLSGATILLLSRKNALRRAISSQLSEQLHLWVRSSPDDLHHIRNHPFAPLDLERLRTEITSSQLLLNEYRSTLSSSTIPWREWSFESLFSPALPPETRLERIQEIFSFLGLPIIKEPARLDKMRHLLRPENTGFQNEHSYERIPNIHEVEKELGNPQTGYVFSE